MEEYGSIVSKGFGLLRSLRLFPIHFRLTACLLARARVCAPPRLPSRLEICYRRAHRQRPACECRPAARQTTHACAATHVCLALTRSRIAPPRPLCRTLGDLDSPALLLSCSCSRSSRCCPRSHSPLCAIASFPRAARRGSWPTSTRTGRRCPRRSRRPARGRCTTAPSAATRTLCTVEVRSFTTHCDRMRSHHFVNTKPFKSFREH